MPVVIYFQQQELTQCSSHAVKEKQRNQKKQKKTYVTYTGAKTKRKML